MRNKQQNLCDDLDFLMKLDEEDRIEAEEDRTIPMQLTEEEALKLGEII